MSKIDTPVKGYKNHRAGSRKGRVHEVFATQGKEAAIKKGVSLKLKETTLNHWVRVWAAEAGGKKPAAKVKDAKASNGSNGSKAKVSKPAAAKASKPKSDAPKAKAPAPKDKPAQDAVKQALSDI